LEAPVTRPSGIARDAGERGRVGLGARLFETPAVDANCALAEPAPSRRAWRGRRCGNGRRQVVERGHVRSALAGLEAHVRATSLLVGDFSAHGGAGHRLELLILQARQQAHRLAARREPALGLHAQRFALHRLGQPAHQLAPQRWPRSPAYSSSRRATSARIGAVDEQDLAPPEAPRHHEWRSAVDRAEQRTVASAETVRADVGERSRGAPRAVATRRVFVPRHELGPSGRRRGARRAHPAFVGHPELGAARAGAKAPESRRVAAQHQHAPPRRAKSTTAASN
jgi:hypothetical protein